MKKLERLTLSELGESVEVLDRRETIGLKGGNCDASN
jgi:natural product precursor